ncbi:MAG: hypothetical protein GVY13_17290 [Alphaproteobacteria bacterium]|jgi:hypothetical protein|nr:hypothetical protein [Alphaproteobacteria bacterium]
MRHFLTAALVALLLAAGPAPAQDLSGVYATEGTNPGDGGRYTGQTEIRRTGDTYRVTAQVGGMAEGTGIFLNGVLSVMFREQGWIATYALQQDGSLRGIWAQDGGQQLGQEILTPQ